MDRIYCQAFEESRSLYDSDNISSWYSIVVNWLFANNLDVNNLPPLRYNYKINKILICHEDCCRDVGIT